MMTTQTTQCQDVCYKTICNTFLCLHKYNIIVGIPMTIIYRLVAVLMPLLLHLRLPIVPQPNHALLLSL